MASMPTPNLTMPFSLAAASIVRRRHRLVAHQQQVGVVHGIDQRILRLTPSGKHRQIDIGGAQAGVDPGAFKLAVGTHGFGAEGHRL